MSEEGEGRVVGRFPTANLLLQILTTIDTVGGRGQEKKKRKSKAC